ncbi:MAG: hypothetical protein KDA41_09855, partial [Planctomycetales bacterium]|nr:hypothetical protein [Planctomycetales bacterium]
MRIAFLHVDAALLDLARQLAASGGHTLTLVGDAGPHAAALQALFPELQLIDNVEPLALGKAYDLLLVGLTGDAKPRLEELRLLVQEAAPLAVVHPAAEAIDLYELGMIQHDTQSLLAGWNPVANSLGAARTAEVVLSPEAPLGVLRQVAMQRRLVDVGREAVVAQLACDLELIERFAGPLDRITALAPGGDA